MTGRETRYTHGHHESVLRSHRWRTVDNSAAYLRPHLAPGTSVLDVGCGPGTVTADLAALVAPAEVLGIDSSAEVVAAARALGAPGTRFEVGDVHDLDLPDDAVDVVHAHQVLQHLGDPVAALREMRRVTRPGGLVAARDADYAAFAWWPRPPGLDRWRTWYRAAAHDNGAEPDAGRRLLGWARAAGFTDVTASSSTWCFADDEDRAWWSQTWADRVRGSALTTQLRDAGITETQIEEVAEAWLTWGREPDGWFSVLHGEVLCRA